MTILQTKHITLIAGEASGDLHGANLAKALRQFSAKNQVELKLTGIGGQKMREAGVNTVIDCADLAVMGFVDVIKHLPKIMAIFKKTVQFLSEKKPDLLILIDYPGFNLRLAKAAKKLGIPVLFYISPQVWAWRRGRVKKIAKVVDHMAVIFPFEVDFYRQEKIPVTYVGHPLTHHVACTMSPLEAKILYECQANHPVIGLLPGSREKEIERLLPLMLQTASLIQKKYPEVQFLLPLASTLKREIIEKYIQNTTIPIRLVENAPYLCMQACDALLVSSGTATLEAALLAKPMVIIYKVPFFTGLLLKYLIKIPHVGLANIVAEKSVVPELLQEQATPEEMSEAVLKSIEDKQYREKVEQELRQIKKKLGNEDGSINTAKIAWNMLNTGT